MDILHLAMDRFLVSTWGEFRSSRQFEAHILKIEYPNIQWLSSIFPNFPIKIMFSGRYTQVSDMTSFSEKFCDLMGDPNLCRKAVDPNRNSNNRPRFNRTEHEPNREKTEPKLIPLTEPVRQVTCLIAPRLLLLLVLLLLLLLLVLLLLLLRLLVLLLLLLLLLLYYYCYY